MAALSDVALIREMRARVPEAWAEFDARYRPLLETYAERTGIPRWERSACITDVLDDVALDLADRAGDPPANLEGYLVRAVRNQYLKLKRAAVRREQHYGDAVGFEGSAEQVVRGLCSEDALRASAGPSADELEHASHALRRLAALLAAQLSAEEKQMLGWVGAGVPRRQIAEWLDMGYDAARKRIYRLSRRMQQLIPAVLDRMSIADRAEAERFLRRVGQRNDDQREAR
jgi:DNA-directed RNA polymerase specialized sigma24 family protein